MIKYYSGEISERERIEQRNDFFRAINNITDTVDTSLLRV